MFDVTNLLKDNQPIGGRSYVVMALWVFGLIVGVYLYQGWREANPVRYRFVQRTGLGVAILSAVGLCVLALRALSVPVMGMPIWGYGVFVVTLGFLAWALYFYTQRLPALLASSKAAVRRPPVQRNTARSYSMNGTTDPSATPSVPRGVGTTSRREARRERKRKGR
ncbi:MAG: hypothetical protein NVS2B7_39420 [Herpetosiphon sp.]